MLSYTANKSIFFKPSRALWALLCSVSYYYKLGICWHSTIAASFHLEHTGANQSLLVLDSTILFYQSFFFFFSLCLCRFDLVANGGASLTLMFERAPFLTQYHTVWIPWNVFYVMDTLVMKKEENDIPSCDLSGFVRPIPVIVSSPLSTFFRSSPEDSPIIPETQV